MRTLSIEDIKIAPERQRQEFEAQAMQELQQSIETAGLLHPIVVRESEGSFVLVSGERRLRAITDIFALDGKFTFDGKEYSDGVPTVTLGELSRLEAEEAELDENLKRKDLTWQEHAAAVKRLHELRGAQKAEKLAGTQLENNAVATTQTVAQTAEELYGRGDAYYGAQTRKEIIVAKHLSNPEVAKAKNVDEAFKVLQRSEKSAENIALAAKIGATFTAEAHRVINDNCLKWMEEHPGNEFDVILTDPPYGMGADSFGDGGGKMTGIEHRYDDSHEAWLLLMARWAKLSFDVCKDQAHAYVFCDIDRFHELKRFMLQAGWYVFRTPLIDYKLNSGRVPLPDRGPRRSWEMILYAIKGDKPVTHIYPDVIPCKADDNMTHGAQKPVELYQNLLIRSVRAGDKVLDTFGGSGTLIPACHTLLCQATVIEQEPEYYGMCLNRLKSLKAAEDPLSELA